MVEKNLTSELIQEGARVLKGLDDAGVAPEAALWFYFSDVSTWRFVVAHRKVGADGPRTLYRAVQKTLQKLRNEVTHMALHDVTVARPEGPPIAQLSKTLATTAGPNGVRFTRNVVDGTLVEDAYIYRLKGAA
jgi:hypothetical protein